MKINIIGGTGLTSCLSVRLGEVTKYINENKQFPSFIDSTYSLKESVVKANHKNEIDIFMKSFTGSPFERDQKISQLFKEDYTAIRPSLQILIDHIDYVAKLIGADHVGLGSDFDGITNVPTDMEDVTKFPNITRELLKRGYSKSDIKKILGENFLRVFEEVCG